MSKKQTPVVINACVGPVEACWPCARPFAEEQKINWVVVDGYRFPLCAICFRGWDCGWSRQAFADHLAARLRRRRGVA